MIVLTVPNQRGVFLFRRERRQFALAGRLQGLPGALTPRRSGPAVLFA
jgi:hypothetical protein